MNGPLLVTGASGFVASVVLALADSSLNVHAASREASQAYAVLATDGTSGRRGIHWHQLNSLSASDWERLFDRVRPGVLLHTAALADIDFSEAHPEVCREVNVGFTETLAAICGARGVRMIFCSTDSVFDGEHAPYNENDTPAPVNVYAASKVAAERAVARLAPNHVTARLALVMGLLAGRAGNSFVAKLLASLRAGKTVGAPQEEIRTPVDVITLARALLELAMGQGRGIYHLAGNTALNRLEMNRAIAAKFDLPARLVQPAPAASMAGRAKRPRDVSLANGRARAELSVPMLDFAAALEQVAHFQFRQSV
jgi:dTDP-4-dehydrorhamnose reductase